MAFIMVDSFCCLFTSKHDLNITYIQIEINKISQYQSTKITMVEGWRIDEGYHQGTGDRENISTRVKKIQPGWHPTHTKLTGQTGCSQIETGDKGCQLEYDKK
jgi:hypothetical protein